jgi:hypothetical protein
MSNINIKYHIIDSVIQLINKENKIDIPIIKKELKFENSIYHLYINDIKIKKTSEHLIKYRCLACDLDNLVSTTQFLNKIKQSKKRCCLCNDTEQAITTKSYQDKYSDSIKLFQTFPEQYKNAYLLSHLTDEDYQRIKRCLISFCNGKLTDIDNYEYWSIYKIHNQINFSSVIYDKKNNTIFKADQPIMRCDNCHNSWRCKSLESFKNCYKILCQSCKLGNQIKKIKICKNINGDNVMYQTRFQLRFINWCKNNNIVLRNGLESKFIIGDIIIDINGNSSDCLCITPKNWDEKCKEIIKLIK